LDGKSTEGEKETRSQKPDRILLGKAFLRKKLNRAKNQGPQREKKIR